ncbi:Zinc finger CCCH domain-containing protein 17 [Linum grandiflorum]
MVQNTNVFKRIRFPGHDQKNSRIVCRFWQKGYCNHNPCRFVHGEQPSPAPYKSQPRSHVYIRPSQSKRWSRPAPQKSKVADEKKIVVIAEDAEKNSREFSFRGDGLSMVTKLVHGNSAVTGLSLPSGFDKLFSGGSDGVLKAWDCNSGEVVATVNTGGKIGCLISEGDWLYVGLPSMVKALNLNSGAEYILNGPTGQVYALAIGMGIVFAGAQDGEIQGWKITPDEQEQLFKPTASLTGHKSPVISLKFGPCSKLFSGSMDGAINVWDCSTFQKLWTFKGHDEAVMSLLYFSDYLISCSLDHKIKVWTCDEEGRLEVVYTHEEEDGALALCGVVRSGKPLLLCSWNDDSVGIYELPSFAEKGRMYLKGEARSLGEGPDGLIFTGDASGLLTVWQLTEEAKMEQ